MWKLHRTCPASGLYNLAALTLMEGTVPHRIAGFPAGIREKMVRIGHPEGVVEVKIKLTEDGAAVESVGMERTARRIMKGELFIPGQSEK
jgi:2-methylaconitate cis-trans-isomerase PrpF